jgi:hypothetical protein
MKSKSFKVKLRRGSSVSAKIGFPEEIRDRPPVVYLAHGAGNGMDSPFMTFFHEYLVHHGCITTKFNFPYMEQGKKAPDTKTNLISCFQEVIEFGQEEFSLSKHALYLGGKSMGGRIASYLGAGGFPLSGLIFLGYPLHPPGKTDQLRDDHLYTIQTPMLFVSGKKDKLAEPELLGKVIQKLHQAKLYQFPEGDHSFRLPKKLGKSEIQVWSDAGQIIVNWIFQRK